MSSSSSRTTCSPPQHDILELAVPPLMSVRHEAIFVRRSRLFTFSELAGAGAWEGATVTYVAMQLAYHLGFRKSSSSASTTRSTTGPAEQARDIYGARSESLRPELLRAGVGGNCPTSRFRGGVPAGSGRIRGARAPISDATVGGKLNVFPKADSRGSRRLRPQDRSLSDAVHQRSAATRRLNVRGW